MADGAEEAVPHADTELGSSISSEGMEKGLETNMVAEGVEKEEAQMHVMESESELSFLHEASRCDHMSHLFQVDRQARHVQGLARLSSSAQPSKRVTSTGESVGERVESSNGSVGIRTESWAPTFEPLSQEVLVSRVTSSASVRVDYLQCKACHHWNEPVEARCVQCQGSIDPKKALHLSKLVTDTQITDTLRSLRAALADAFTMKRAMEGGMELEQKLMEVDPVDSLLDIPTFVDALSDLGVHVLKRHIRPLFAHPNLKRPGGIQREAISALLNAKQWWPTEESFRAAEDLETELVRKELDDLLGPKLSKAIAGDQSLDYIKELLDTVKKDMSALTELKSFLDAIPPAQLEEGRKRVEPAKATGSRSRSKSPAMSKLPPPRPHSSAEGSLDRASPSPAQLPNRSPSSLGIKDKKLKPYVSNLETKAPVISQKWPYGSLSMDLLPKSNIEWKTWEDGKTGKVHEPIPIPLASLGSSRKRANEFYSEMAKASKEERDSMNHSREFWRKLSRPNMAVEYVRWQLLEQPIPGFSPPSMIETKKNPEPWKPLKPNSQFKIGSRHADPNDGTVEKLKPTTMLTDDLKVERGKSKMVLEGTECLKRTRLHVIRGTYDAALQETELALSKFKGAGKYGQHMARELRSPQDQVVKMIKAEMDKLLKVSSEALERHQCDKALSQIPRLRQACSWLGDHGVTYPERREATHWEVRQQISSDTFPQGMEVIDELKGGIQEQEQQAALQLDAAATSSFFSVVHPVLDLSNPVHLAEVEAATKHRNRLPKTITADGTTFLLVVDLKSPDLPEKIKVNTPVFVRGERTLDSGKAAGDEWLSGTVVSWNIRGDKYKVQYDDDYEWIQTPTNLEVEINMFPEEVLFEADNGFLVRSVTHEHPTLGKKVAVVAFTIVPPGPVYDLTKFGEIELKVTGVKSKKRLVEDGPMSRSLVLPPKFLLPGASYRIHDAITGEALDGELEFTHAEDKTRTTFSVGEAIQLPKEGIYHMVAKGEKDVGYPYTSEHSTCLWYEALQSSRDQRGEARLFLNKHIPRSDEMRVVVSWGPRPGALDSYTYTSEREMIDWRRSGKKVNGICLNIDTSTGYGPETITMRVKKSVGYAFSLKMTEGAGASDYWTASNAQVTLFDHTGTIAVFHVPPVRQGIKGMWWWHVFALDGGLWDRPGHGLLRVNQLSSHELSQVAVPGWTLMEAARHGQWGVLSEHLNLYGHGKTADEPALLPRQLAGAMTMEGETLLGLVCLHNPGSAEDKGVGLDEDGKSPLQKQVEALNNLMWWTVELEKRNRSTEAENGGIPTESALEKECKVRGVRDCYIYRAVMYGSMEVAVAVLNQVGVVCRRSTSGAPIRVFFHKHGDDLLDLCVQKRSVSSLEKVLHALLGIEAIWERRLKRVFQEADKVQVELKTGNGQWMDGVIVKRSWDTYKVQFAGGRREVSMHVWEETTSKGIELAGETEVVASKPRPAIDVVPARLRWRTPALERAKALLHRTQQEIKTLEFGSHGNMQSGKARFLLNCEAVYKRAVTMLTDKAFE